MKSNRIHDALQVLREISVFDKTSISQVERDTLDDLIAVASQIGLRYNLIDHGPPVFCHNCGLYMTLYRKGELR